MSDLVVRLRACVNYGDRLPVNAAVLQLMAEAACEIERLRAGLGEIASGLSVNDPYNIANEVLKN